MKKKAHLNPRELCLSVVRTTNNFPGNKNGYRPIVIRERFVSHGEHKRYRGPMVFYRRVGTGEKIDVFPFNFHF